MICFSVLYIVGVMTTTTATPYIQCKEIRNINATDYILHLFREHSEECTQVETCDEYRASRILTVKGPSGYTEGVWLKFNCTAIPPTTPPPTLQPPSDDSAELLKGLLDYLLPCTLIWTALAVLLLIEKLVKSSLAIKTAIETRRNETGPSRIYM